MNDLQPLTDERITAFKVQSFARSFLASPLARAMFERGEPLRFFLPVLEECSLEWKGVEITIAGVPHEVTALGRGPQTLSLRGNGHCDNPRGPLMPWDYGVHSHPDTAKLLTTDERPTLGLPAKRRHARGPRS